MAETAYALYFESKNVVRLKKGVLIDGFLDLGDKAFDVNNFTPKLLRKGFSFYPLYMLKWDCVNPSEEFNPTFKRNEKISPEILKKTLSLKILGNMLKIKKRFPPLLLLGIGLAFGAFFAYLFLSVLG